MADNALKQNLLDLSLADLKAFFEEHGEKAFRAVQIVKWVYQRGVIDFDQMTDLSKNLREWLKLNAICRLPAIAVDQASADGTHKWLLQLDDGNCIETVFIPENGRGTLCISSQVGCILNCSFCSTARQGFNRNLTVAEVIGQLWIAAHALGQYADGADRKVTNVVMMGMGEPLLNYNNVLDAMKLMLEDNAFGLSKRRITLSTAGVIPGMDKLSHDLGVSLAVSLHACNDTLRNELVPLNKKYPIEALMQACQRYVDNGLHRKITFEYVMLAGVNDRDSDARDLVKLLKDIPSKVNLIPFNPFPNSNYETSSPQRIKQFVQILHDSGVITLTRKTRGDDIDAACGQLAGKVKDKTMRSIKMLKAAGA